MIAKENVLDVVMGEAEFPSEVVPAEVQDEFQEGGACEQQVEQIFNARMRLAERFGMDFEDPDLMEIICAYDDMVRCIALKMYDYGAAFGREAIAVK